MDLKGDVPETAKTLRNRMSDWSSSSSKSAQSRVDTLAELFASTSSQHQFKNEEYNGKDKNYWLGQFNSILEAIKKMHYQIKMYRIL